MAADSSRPRYHFVRGALVLGFVPPRRCSSAVGIDEERGHLKSWGTGGIAVGEEHHCVEVSPPSWSLLMRSSPSQRVEWFMSGSER